MMRVTVVSGGQTVTHKRVVKISDYNAFYVYVHDLDSSQRVRYPLRGTTMTIETYKEEADGENQEAGSRRPAQV